MPPVNSWGRTFDNAIFLRPSAAQRWHPRSISSPFDKNAASNFDGRIAMTLREDIVIDEQKLQQFLRKMIVNVGAATSVPLMRIGVRLGLYKAMHGAGPLTSAEFAAKANISERYAREWLAQSAASGYLTYDSASRRFELPVEQAMVFARIAGRLFPAEPRRRDCRKSTSRRGWARRPNRAVESRPVMAAGMMMRECVGRRSI
jgi:hypothetical protein